MKAPLYAPLPLVPAGRNQQRDCGIVDPASQVVRVKLDPDRG